MRPRGSRQSEGHIGLRRRSKVHKQDYLGRGHTQRILSQFLCCRTSRCTSVPDTITTTSKAIQAMEGLSDGLWQLAHTGACDRLQDIPKSRALRRE